MRGIPLWVQIGAAVAAILIVIWAIYWIRETIREAIEGPKSLRLSLPMPDKTAAYFRVIPLRGSEVSSEALARLVQYVANRKRSEGGVPRRMQYVRGEWLPVEPRREAGPAVPVSSGDPA